MVWGQESTDNYRPTGSQWESRNGSAIVKLGSSIKTFQEAANWLYHLVYESLLAMTAVFHKSASLILMPPGEHLLECLNYTCMFSMLR